MLNIPTKSELFEITREVILAGQSKIDPAEIDREGSDINILCNVLAEMGMAVAYRGSAYAKAVILDLASGIELDEYGWRKYREIRKLANPAQVAVTASRLASGIDCTITAGDRFESPDNIVYIASNTYIVPGASLEYTGIEMYAAELGEDKALNADIVLAPQFAIADTSVTFTTAEKAAGATPVESDNEYRERLRLFFINARRGTLEAIAWAAASVTGVKYARAETVCQPYADEYGRSIPAMRVNLYIADKNGACNSVLANDVLDKLEEWRGAGIPVRIVGGSLNEIEVTLHLSFATGIDTRLLSSEVTARLKAIELAPGEILYIADIMKTVKGVAGVIIEDDGVREPSGDLIPVEGQIIKITQVAFE